MFDVEFDWQVSQTSELGQGFHRSLPKFASSKTNSDKMAAAVNLNPGFNVSPASTAPDTISLFFYTSPNLTENNRCAEAWTQTDNQYLTVKVAHCSFHITITVFNWCSHWKHTTHYQIRQTLSPQTGKVGSTEWCSFPHRIRMVSEVYSGAPERSDWVLREHTESFSGTNTPSVCPLPPLCSNSHL